MKYLLHIGLTTGATLELEFPSEELRYQEMRAIMLHHGDNSSWVDTVTNRKLIVRNRHVVYVREFNRDESGHVTTAGRIIND